MSPTTFGNITVFFFTGLYKARRLYGHFKRGGGMAVSHLFAAAFVGA